MSNFLIKNNVRLGMGAKIGEFCVIGELPSGRKGRGVKKTVIGDNALIRSHTVIYTGNKIGKNFQTGHGVLIREENEIGDNVGIGSHSVIEHHVKIGNNVRIHSNSFIPEYSVLEDSCWVGPCVVFTDVLHPLCPKAKKCVKGPIIKKGAKIGAGSVLLPDITIGECSLIGAGSVVVDNIPSGVVAFGNPAKVIKKISDLKCKLRLIKKPY